MIILLSNNKQLCVNTARNEWLLFTKESPIIVMRSYDLRDIHKYIGKSCIAGNVGNYRVLIRIFNPTRRSKFSVYNVLLGKTVVFKTDILSEFLGFGGFKCLKNQ